MNTRRFSWPRLNGWSFGLLIVMLGLLQTAAEAWLSSPNDPSITHWGWYVLRFLYLGFPWLWLGQDSSMQLAAVAVWAYTLSLVTALVVLRLKTLGWPLRWTLLLFAPGVHGFFLLALCLAPFYPVKSLGRTVPSTPAWIEELETQEHSRRQQDGSGEVMTTVETARSDWPATTAAAAIYALRGDYARMYLREQSKLIMTVAALAISFGIAAVVLSTSMGTYGLSLFIGAPFLVGFWLTLIICSQGDIALGDCVLVYCVALLLGAALLVIIGVEGIICLLMASSLVFLSGMAGCALAYGLSRHVLLSASRRRYYSGVLLIWPMMLGVETLWPLGVSEHAVRTEIIIHAPPERVWQTVLAFPPLPEPKELLFRLGAAYPVAAQIHGQGPGAVRHCIFNTGTFVEPILVWEPARCLRFAVTDQPAPMRELSPWDIHPPHLHGYLVCRQGEFLLEPLPDGSTRLIGTTWYVNHMWPQWYWYL
ncbi:MAG: hypothetical protein RMI91_07100 [Gemmatales bacterium]|nr:hypothetical protein [Gemmatales bacterium]MDW7994405.1 hypothetical protein [Gemmatales bacterium]